MSGADIDQHLASLRAWVARSEAAEPADFARLLGEGEALVKRLLRSIDEGAR